MNSSDLTTDQAAKMAAAIRSRLYYLTRLKQRMERRHFNQKDRFFVCVRDAHSAMQALYGELHSMSCRSGMGRPERK